MEDKIEVGEYVKLQYGKIDQVKNNDYYMQQYIECEKGLYLRENIVKHSKHKLKLIEAGDYVNGYKVLAIEKHFQVQPYRISIMVYKTKDVEFWKSLEEQDIEDIVTKEKFESVKYKVQEAKDANKV